MKEKIKIAIIGCGRFAQHFVPLFKAHPVVEKVYVCDLMKERAEEYSKRFDVEIINSFEEALQSDKINAVAIFTQRFKHGKMVIEALKAGKHVYSAVPGSVDVEDFAEIEKLVRKTRLTYSMGETGCYRSASIFCRDQYKKGNFGKFVYGEAQYGHDIRNMEESYKSSGKEDWKKYAGLPPMFYPTHPVAMLLSALPGVYAKRVMAFGFKGSKRTDIFGTDGQNLYNNPFSNTTMLIELSNGGIIRSSENRCIGWQSPESAITQFFGEEGGYEFSVARHSYAHWNPEDPHNVIMKDVTKDLQPDYVYDLINSDYNTAIQKLSNNMGFFDECPNQPTSRLPKEYNGLPNGHNGTHKFLIDDFCRAYETGKLSPTNIWQTARFNIPGLLAHQSALENGKTIDVVDLGDPPEDWEVLDFDR